MILRRTTGIDRILAIAIVLAVLALQVVVLLATNAAAAVEYNYGFQAREHDEGASTPWPAAYYRSVYGWSWWWLAIAGVWGGWIVRKRRCNLFALVCYVGVSINLSVGWLLFTLLALYLINQVFYT